MVEINVSNGQGITQAIKSQLKPADKRFQTATCQYGSR